MPKAQTPQTLTGLARIIAKYGERALVVSEVDSSTKPTPNRILVDVSHIPRFGTVTSRGAKGYHRGRCQPRRHPAAG